MKKVVVVGGVLVLGLMAWSYFSPHLAMHQMKQAIENKDASALAKHVDFPALRENLKAQMTTYMNQKMTTPEMQSNPFAGLGKMMASAMIGPMIDNMVSPSGVIMMMNNATAAKPANQPSVGAAPGTPSQTQKKRADFSLRYQSWDSVAVKRSDQTEDGAGFLLSRHGLWSWKLTSIQLPADLMKLQ